MTRSKNPNPRQVTDEDGKEITNPKDGAMEINKATLSSDVVVEEAEDDRNEIVLRIDMGEIGSQLGGQSPGQNDITAKRDALAKLTAAKFAAVYNASDENGGGDGQQEEDMDFANDETEMNGGNDAESLKEAETPEPRTSLNFAPSSPPSFFVMGPKSRILTSTSSRPPPPLRKMVQATDGSEQGLSSFSKNTKTRLKTSSPSGMLNPEIMNWLRNRFEMKPGGRISASDIIRIYSEDMKDLPDPPPTLQNYQVGQLLRRVFPAIQRCKITVNSKRVWVYRHLSLIHHHNPSSFCTQFDGDADDDESPDTSSKDNAINGDDAEMEGNCGVSDSPVSNAEHDDTETLDDSAQSPNGLDEEAETKDNDRKKSNAILLGLLGQRGDIKREISSPTSFTELDSKEESASPYGSKDNLDLNSSAPFKKKRDSEVVEWLLENYKFKTGYYVKSMDLLRRYNDGREELVKYLSQVGRVMKHVFPGVRHLRKSFRGGKREWVYLNLKPIEVVSDSEEAKSMQMFNVRRPPQPPKFEASKIIIGKKRGDYPDWKHERVNITHMPLSLTQNRNAIFKPRANIYHSVSRVDGNKLIISRNPSGGLALEGDSGGRSDDFARQEVEFSNVPRLKNMEDRSPNRTRIILYNKHRDQEQKPEECRAPSDLERDIFAPFVRMNGASNDGAFHSVSAMRVTSDYSSWDEKDKQISLLSRPGQQASWVPKATQRVFPEVSTEAEVLSADDSDSGATDSRWASKRLRMCATETMTDVPNDDVAVDETRPALDSSPVGLDLSIKQEHDVEDKAGDDNQGNDNVASDKILNLSKSNNTPSIPASPKVDRISVKIHASPTIHYRPTEESALSLQLKSGQSSDLMLSGASRQINAKPSCDLGSDATNTHIVQGRAGIPGLAKFVNGDGRELKRVYDEMNARSQDNSISWSFLQTFNAQRYGWLRSPHTSWTTSKSNDRGGKKVLRFVEWFLFSGQWLINRQRALREIKIYDDWTVVIHALGRRVYPNDLGGITDLEKTSESLNKVFRVLAEAKLCMGFPAPSISDLYIHGILVSKFEVWSSREDSGEDIRQRAVNCQILYSGNGACCNKCTRIMRLHQQQRRSSGLIKRAAQTESTSQPRSLSKPN